MTNREGASLPAHVLNDAQRKSYFADGYLLLEGLVSADWQSRLRAAIAETIEKSRSMTDSSKDIWLEQGHSAAEPRLLRLNRPDIHHPDFWAFATESPLPDIAADFLGPDVRFSHRTQIYSHYAEDGAWTACLRERDLANLELFPLQFQMGRRIGQAVKWHHGWDIPFYPHTQLCGSLAQHVPSRTSDPTRAPFAW